MQVVAQPHVPFIGSVIFHAYFLAQSDAYKIPQVQRRIQNRAEHLQWSFHKKISIADVRPGSKYVSQMN